MDSSRHLVAVLSPEILKADWADPSGRTQFSDFRELVINPISLE
jgi:hypothetical protein